MNVGEGAANAKRKKEIKHNSFIKKIVTDEPPLKRMPEMTTLLVPAEGMLPFKKQ